MEYLEIRGVGKSFDGISAVRDASLTVREGSVTVILGPSGCGKSTLLRIVAGLETPDQGKVFLAGRDITDLPPGDRNIAMVFQDYALYPHMTVEKNMTFGLTLRGVARSEAKKRALDTARLLGIDGLLGKKPGALSGGERQRLAVGRAIIKKPRLFLMDEPLSNVDAQQKSSMRAEIGRIIRGLFGTMLWVTHDQVEAMSVADQLVVMRGGQIVGEGRARELYETPPNLFVATFLGSPPMNIIRPGSPLFSRLAGGGGYGIGDNILVGVRPEDITVGGGELTGRVVFCEELGFESRITIEHGERGNIDSLIARVIGVPPEVGKTIRFSIDKKRLSLFSRVTERRVGR